LEVITQNNFSNQKQVELLQILNFALYKKNYPQDLCGIIDRKIPLLEQAEHAANAACPQSPQIPHCPNSCGEIQGGTASIKVRSVVILELLKKL
jgi:hypothetical protein